MISSQPHNFFPFISIQLKAIWFWQIVTHERKSISSTHFTHYLFFLLLCHCSVTRLWVCLYKEYLFAKSFNSEWRWMAFSLLEEKNYCCSSFSLTHDFFFSAVPMPPWKENIVWVSSFLAGWEWRKRMFNFIDFELWKCVSINIVIIIICA